jgi:anthranilate phosphoribosyltransferase
LPLLAGALRELNALHALVVHGEGMDEISPFGNTQVIEIRDGRAAEWTIDPTRYGFGRGTPDDVAGGPPAENAATVMRVLRGDGTPAATAAVALNAAAALYVGGVVDGYDAGVEAALSAIEAGAGLVALDRLRVAFARN